MASFSATDAAFEGFRLTREQPRTLLIWAAFNLVVSVISLVLLIGVGGSSLQAMMEMEQAAAGAEADPAQALEALRSLGLIYALILPVALITQSMLGAAVYRAILRPSDGGVGYLKLGGDEFRLVGLSLIYFLLTILAVVAVTFIAGIVVGLLGAAIGAGAAALLGVGLGLFIGGLMIFVVVRLSLAGVITFAQRRLAIFDSWSLTRGQFWSMAGAYVLTLAAIMVIVILSLIIFTAVAAIASGGDFAAVGTIFSPDVTSLAAYMTPTMIAYTVFGAMLNAVYYAAMFAPHAVIYRALTGDERAEVFA